MCQGYVLGNLIIKEHDHAVFKLLRFVLELFGSVINTEEWLCLNGSNTSGSILGDVSIPGTAFL